MANQIHAVQAYTPRVLLSDTIEIDDVAEYIEGRTAFNAGAIVNMLMEFKSTLTVFALRGMAVKLKGLGTFSPTIDKDGGVSLNFRPDKGLRSDLNVKGKFKGNIKNRDMLGASVSDFVDRWNAEHPDDQIKVKKKKK